MFRHSTRLLAATLLFSLPLLPAAASPSALPTAAPQDNRPVVTIDGTPVDRTLTRITFSGDNVILHFSDDAADETADLSAVTVSLPLATAVGRLHTYATARIVGDQLTLGHLSAGDRIAIYDTAGRRMLQTRASGNETTLQLTSLKAGVYIVRTGNSIIKFHKR